MNLEQLETEILEVLLKNKDKNNWYAHTAGEITQLFTQQQEQLLEKVDEIVVKHGADIFRPFYEELASLKQDLTQKGEGK